MARDEASHLHDRPRAPGFCWRNVSGLSVFKSSLVLRFLITIVLAAGIVWAFVLYGAQQAFFERPSFFVPALIFIALSTTVIYFYLYTADKPAQFVQLYLLTMAIKLLASLAFCFVMISRDKPSAVGNVVFFMCTYFLFTGIEISFLYHRISGRKGS